VLLVLVIGFIVWVMAHDSLAWYGYLGEAAFLCLLIVLVVGMVGPPLRPCARGGGQPGRRRRGWTGVVPGPEGDDPLGRRGQRPCL